MTSSLGVSSGAAGQAVTMYAAGTALTAIPLAAATAGIRRKPLLLGATTVFLIANTLTAAAPGYAVLLIARFLAGVAAGLAWAILMRLRAPHRASRPGRPCHRDRDDRDPSGAVAGCSRRDADRPTDRVASVLRRRLSDHPRRHRVDHVQRSRRRSRPTTTAEEPKPTTRQTLRVPGVTAVMVVVVTFVLGHTIIYAYIAPYLRHMRPRHRSGRDLAGLRHRMPGQHLVHRSPHRQVPSWARADRRNTVHPGHCRLCRHHSTGCCLGRSRRVGPGMGRYTHTPSDRSRSRRDASQPSCRRHRAGHTRDLVERGHGTRRHHRRHTPAARRHHRRRHRRGSARSRQPARDHAHAKACLCNSGPGRTVTHANALPRRRHSPQSRSVTTARLRFPVSCPLWSPVPVRGQERGQRGQHRLRGFLNGVVATLREDKALHVVGGRLHRFADRAAAMAPASSAPLTDGRRPAGTRPGRAPTTPAHPLLRPRAHCRASGSGLPGYVSVGEPCA